MTPSAADLRDRPGTAGVIGPARRWLWIGRVAAAASLVLCVVVQLVNHDFFPPRVSVSQYGVGPRGWVFTGWVAVVALAVLALYAGGTTHGHGAGYWLVVGAVGLVVMGVVRTDADGLQHSPHAKVHMVAAIVTLVALPIGMAMAMRNARAGWRNFAWTMVTGGAVALVMVLISAAGIATLGLDAPHSWAMWQAIAITLDMLLLAAMLLASFPGQQVRPADRPPG